MAGTASHPTGAAGAGNATKPGGSGWGATGASAGGHGSGYDPVAMARREVVNFWVATNYAAFLSGLIGVFIILHWARLGFNKAQSKKSPGSSPGMIVAPFVWTSRRIRNVLVRSIPGFYSSGHGLLTFIYVAVNLVMIFTNVEYKSYGNVAARFGWILSANIVFVVFLGLKNTPLAILTSYSYERLNNLHQIAGCTTFLMLVMHASLYTVQFANINKWDKLRHPDQIAGIISAFAFLSMVASALLIRKVWYELFYVMHIVCFVVGIVTIGFHRPEFPHKTAIVACVAGGIWVLDRAIRMTRLAINGVNNEATVYPLASGGTRIILAKRPARAAPGKHAFLWLPSVRKFETHPFTIIDTDPMEFVVKTYNGFTRDLFKFAEANPGARVRCSVDGPYGTFPDPMLYDRVVLIAGGSGASFTFGLAVNLLERMGPESTKSIIFIWAVRKHENLAWYSEHLRTLHDHPNSPKCKVQLYATRAPSSASSDDEASSAPRNQTGEAAPTSSDIEKIVRDTPPRPTTATKAAENTDEKKAAGIQEFHSERHGDTTDDDVVAVVPPTSNGNTNARHRRPRAGGADDAEADAPDNASASTMPLQHVVTPGRPDAATLIRNAVDDTPRHQRVLIAACGPPSLMKVARNTAAQCIRGDGPGVELHCEQFGW